MKIIQKISAAALAVLASCQLFAAPTGKSFYSMRPITSYPLFRPQLGHDKRSNHFMISATPLYHASANGNNFHRYFMPGGKDELLVAGARLGDVGQDLSAAWFNIAGDVPGLAADDHELYINNFKSRFTFKPSFRMYGASLHAQQSVRVGDLMLELSAQLPVLEAQANTRVEEVILGGAAKSFSDIDAFVIQNPGLDVIITEKITQLHSLSLTQALSNRAFMPKGRLAPTRTVARGLGDLVLTAGADVVTRGSYTARVTARLTAPTADKPTAEYLFQPLLGNNGHWGIGVEWGNSLHFTPAESTVLTVHQKISYDYFLPAHELRTFDLIGRPWSRYVQVTNDGSPYAGGFTPLKTAGPATGAFTLKASVTPREQLALSHACTGSLGRMSITAGHEWYYKRAEDLKLKGSLGEGRFIALSEFNNASTPQAYAFGTNPNATVASHPYGWGGAAPAAPAGYQALANNLVITDKDLDLRSAQQPQYTAHTLFVQAQAHFDETSMLSIGGQYEFAVSKNRPDVYSVALTLNKRV